MSHQFLGVIAIAILWANASIVTAQSPQKDFAIEGDLEIPEYDSDRAVPAKPSPLPNLTDSGTGRAKPVIDAQDAGLQLPEPSQVMSSPLQESVIQSGSISQPRLTTNTEAHPSSSFSQTITISVPSKREIVEEFQTPNGVQRRTREITAFEAHSFDIDQDLSKLKLDPTAERAVVTAITVARHQGLVAKLKSAESEDERKSALDALRENYVSHYSIETKYRESKLAELEKKLKKLRDELKQRSDSQEKYVEAAMTIAELHAAGIAIQPPSLSSQPAAVTQYPGTGTREYSGAFTQPGFSSTQPQAVSGNAGLLPSGTQAVDNQLRSNASLPTFDSFDRARN